MTSQSLTHTDQRAARASAPARVASLARAELLLLVRNRTALFNAVALAPLTVAFLASLGMADALAAMSHDRAVGGMLVTMLVALALLFVVYYNLTTTLVARREELVLKRLLTGDVSRTEVVLACATPAVVVMVLQLGLGLAAVTALFAAPSLQSLPALLLGILGGTTVFALLAVVSSGLTRTVESAQLTTLPVLAVTMALSGFVVPLHLMPEALGTVAEWTPLYPVVTLLQQGLGAVTLAGTVPAAGATDLLQPVAALGLWAVLGVLAGRRWMRWEPRR